MQRGIRIERCIKTPKNGKERRVSRHFLKNILIILTFNMALKEAARCNTMVNYGRLAHLNRNTIIKVNIYGQRMVKKNFSVSYRIKNNALILM